MAPPKRDKVAVKTAAVTKVQRPSAHPAAAYQTSYTKYNAETHASILECVEKGRSIKDTGLLVGLGKDTLDSWMYQGRHEPEKYPHFAKLVEDIEVAKAKRRAQAVDKIVEVGQSGQPGTWQANAWFLERTDPENWGRKDKVEHVNDAPRQQINQVILIDSEARAASRDLLQRVAGNSRPDVTIGPGGGVQLEAGEGSRGGESE